MKTPPTLQPKKTIPYGRQQISEEDIEAVVSILKSDYLTQGPSVQQFESALCQYTGARFAVSYSSGTSALHGAYHAAGITKHDEVLTSPVSFAATTNAVLYCSGTPVFCDVEPSTAELTVQNVEKKLTPKTKVITPIDLRGYPCEMSNFRKFADEHKLRLIRDGAHSLGASYVANGTTYKVGSCAHEDMCILSFHPIKSITTGEGGAVLTNDTELYQSLVDFRQHGITKNKQIYQSKELCDEPWFHEMHSLGFNYRLTDLQCALGISQMKTLDAKIQRRRDIVNTYEQELCSLVNFLKSEDEHRKSAHHIAVVLVPDNKRNALSRYLNEHNIGTQVHYIPIYRHPYYQNTMRTDFAQFPNTEAYFAQTLTLPVYPDFTESDQQYVLDCIKAFFKK